MVSVTAIVIGFGKIWVEFYGYVIVFDGAVKLASIAVSVAAIVIRIGKLGVLSSMAMS